MTQSSLTEARVLMEQAVTGMYNIFDHDETSCIFCILCGAEAPPTQETGYDYRCVVHEENCIVLHMQQWLLTTPEDAEVLLILERERAQLVNTLLHLAKYVRVAINEWDTHTWLRALTHTKTTLEETIQLLEQRA